MTAKSKPKSKPKISGKNEGKDTSNSDEKTYQNRVEKVFDISKNQIPLNLSSKNENRLESGEILF